MADLVYYRKENQEFKEAFDKKMSCEEAEIIYSKLCRHFKLRRVRLEWTSGRNHPCCSSWRVCLNYNWNTFGVLCHEVAHLFQFQKLPEHRHDKKHWKVMKRMIKYCEKRNWFEDELKRRTEPKPIKLEPTKEELRKKKIERLEQSSKRCTSKIKRYENLIKKNNRKIAHLKKFI